MRRVARIVAAAGFTVNKMLKEGNVLFNDAKENHSATWATLSY